MQHNYESYSECMKGVILEHNYDKSYHSTLDDYILKILVNDPFNAEISIRMNTDTWNEYVNYYAGDYWRGFLESHPERSNKQDFYCNLQDRKFYMVSTIDDKGYPVWEETTLRSIIGKSHLAWRFSRHIHIGYNKIHVGQHCEFVAYAMDNNERLYKPSTIDENFSKYTWIYEPLTFKAGEITSKSIEHLIARMEITERVAHIVNQKQKSQKEESRKKATQELKLKVKTPFSNLWEKFTKEETPINILWKVLAIISSIIAIWALFFKDQ